MQANLFIHRYIHTYKMTMYIIKSCTYIYIIKICIYNPILCIIKVEIKLNYMKSNYKI